RSFLVLAVLAAGLVTDPRSTFARKAPKPEPCPPARYLISGGPIGSDGSGSALELGSSVSLDGVCDSVPAKRNQANRKGITQVLARWKHCNGLNGAVVLQGKILPGCSQFQGTLRAKKFKKPVSAGMSRCGDGIVDAGGGEQCDDGNATPGDGCEPDCTATPPTTTTAPVTTTTVAPATTTTTRPSLPTTSTTLFHTTTTTSPSVTTSTVSSTSTT